MTARQPWAHTSATAVPRTRKGRMLGASLLAVTLAFTTIPATSWATTGESGTGSDSSTGGDNGMGSTGDTGTSALAAAEDVPDISMTMRIASDGTPSWDADSAAGNDSGPNNGVVRVNDTVTYEVEYAVSNSPATNLTWSATFPKGMEITQLPGYCQATGSSISPATAGTPTIPLTATSIDQLSEQTITCNMGDRSVATDKVFVTLKVLNVAHQGQDLPVLAASVTADGVTEPVPASAPLPTVAASARLMWDISKNGTVLTADSGYKWGPGPASCPWDTTKTCVRTAYPVLFSAPAGGKGAMPAIGDVTFVDDLSPRAMYPGLTEAQYVAMEADLDTYGSSLQVHQAAAYASPGVRIGGTATATNSVRDSGVLAQDTAARGTMNHLTVAGADWSLRTYPTQSLSPAAALPATSAYAVSVQLSVFTPVATIRDFGIENNGTWTLPTRNTFTQLSISGFESTDTQSSADQPVWNDYRNTTPILTFNPGASKSFVGVAGAAGNMTPTEFTPSYGGWEGPPGGSTIGSGGITVAPTQNVTSTMGFTGSASTLPGQVSYLACDSWDNTKLYLREGDVPSSSLGAVMQRVPSNGEAVWVSGYNNVPNTALLAKYATDAAQVPEIEVQYAAAPSTSAGAGTACGDDTGPWFDAPADVPGGDAALKAQGVYTNIGRVRVSIVLPEPTAVAMADQGAVRANVSISMQVADAGFPAGTVIPNFFGVKSVKFESLSMSELLTNSAAWVPSTYVPATHSGYPRGDRLILALAQARIDKQVRKGDSGAFSNTPPQVTGGDLVQYQLTPSLTSGAYTPGILKDVWVEDCLPASQTYDTASVTPAVVSPGSTPADAKRPACAAGETYIRWVLPNHEVNTVITPIILSVEVSPVATDGVYTNTVVVWAKDDESTLAQRSDQAQIQIANIAGIKLEKVALTPVVQVNRPEATEQELNRWAVRLTNTLPASDSSGVSSPDVIDVLPKQGTQGTTFHGTFTFDSAEVTQGGADTRILYTSAAAISANPRDASNGASGATTWCDAPAGGTVVSGTGACPATASEVTGLRIVRPGAYASGEVIEIELSMVGVGNAAGDVYVNRAMAAATGLENPIGPIRRPETVIASSVGDFVWWDLNRNGVQDSFHGESESAASGITVRLSGTDDLGNVVSEETTTDADGNYTFPGLRASDDAGYTVTFVRPDGTEFTMKNAEDIDVALDSNADPESGASDPVVLPANTVDATIDAGLLPYGDLQINKSLTGAGAGEFSASDTLVFDVVCTFDPQLEGVAPVEVLTETVSLDVNGADAVTSDLLGPLPAYTSCAITETDAGSADATAAPVTVTVPWDATAQQSGTVTASLTNFYSAGSVEITKKLDGNAKAVEAAKDKVFEILVVCQIEEQDSEGASVLVDVYSGSVLIKGGQTKYLVNENDEPRALPLGATCFGNEVNTGGASASDVDHDSFENGVTVTDGDPENLQVLTITAVNTFGKLAQTGGLPIVGVLLGGVGLLIMGGAVLLLRRTRREHETTHTV